MAKAESGLRQRIKKALEVDGWSVVTQHGSAYSPNVPDLLVVVAALEVKTETGSLRPGQRNRIRKFRRAGIPAGVVRSVAEARQGMAIVKQGVYRVADDNPTIDMSFLESIINGPTAVAEPPTPAPEPEPSSGLTELLGMPGKYETFEAVPAPDPEPEPAPAVVPQEMQDLVDRFDAGSKVQIPDGSGPISFPNIASLTPQYPAVPAAGLGVMEQIVGYLAHIDQMLSTIVSGYGDAVRAPENNKPAPQLPTGEESVVRRRRGRPPKDAETTPEE